MNNALGWIIFPGEQLGLDHWLDLIRELFYTGSTACKPYINYEYFPVAAA